MTGDSPSGELRGVAILLVEDDAHVAEGLTLLLELEGAHVRTVTSASAALDVVSSRIPDLFIIALGLPGVSGAQLYTQLRARGIRRPVIISSGYEPQNAVEPLLRDPATRYLQKPYGLEDLCRTVRELFEQQSSGEEAPATSRHEERR